MPSDKGFSGEEMSPETAALDATPPKPEGRIVSKRMIPATEADTAHTRKILLRMPFAGDMFAPHVRAIEAEPIPPINSRGGRDVEGWTAVYEAIVQPCWVNGSGGLHGAAAAWLVDMCTGTSFSRLRTKTWNPGGPSIAIDMSYYNPAPAGTRLRVTTVIDRMGGQLSTARCLMNEWESGLAICSGMHTTFKRPRKKALGSDGQAGAVEAKL
ncbi:hypothetical protein CcaverHIS002_0113130 [Cutaneotrichosporon cavernicola]|uniref:Thioesterase domain-containing protein n=1 Tax=Cutaneotrichosporon cavernicola TaxID=279322 RepID=A0AA48L1A7_9TREE|nr:uncharacterized protein CcaverHIS019_0113000 [Cutaneotrichosporon cavernicola]BEI80784.1 hypothetical protein CcaverHIS002_0113130 [Cutaneotrichosporon cavernicola]BEI88582.1 hypothetical protein CcaverHIS019_0113000 [Cutaneotrichosporon cavernicola]BEI96355.1 hypothetical protein CcaverHIS631_0113040 [Cutaneotrichosporon cavernicola]BEJ04127.1 hypothetical protein CcaverHIS641_0113020 [Cutaneotrichosporon cavernicola]